MTKIIQQFSRWLPIASLTFIGWAAQVNPESATSNLSKWIKFIGIGNAPSILIKKDVDNYVFWVSFSCLILYILIYFLKFIFSFFKKLKESSPILSENHQPITTNVIAKAHIVKVESKTASAPSVLEDPINFEILYAKKEDNDLIWLRFLPDTENQNQDAFVLILYGYKLIHGIDDIPIPHINASLRESGCVSKDKKETSLETIIPILKWLPSAPTADDIVRELRYDYVGEKLGLSRGGTYRLTTMGECHALKLAKDLIRRA